MKPIFQKAAVVLLSSSSFQLQKFLKLYPDLLEYLHISDQYSGKKPDDSTAPSGSTSSNSGAGGSGGSSSSGSSSPVVGAGSTMKVLQARFAVPKYGRAQPEDMAQMLPCLKLVIYFIDKLKRIKLSKDVSRHLGRLVWPKYPFQVEFVCMSGLQVLERPNIFSDNRFLLNLRQLLLKLKIRNIRFLFPILPTIQLSSF